MADVIVENLTLSLVCGRPALSRRLRDGGCLRAYPTADGEAAVVARYDESCGKLIASWHFSTFDAATAALARWPHWPRGGRKIWPVDSAPAERGG